MDGTGELFAPLERALGQSVFVHRISYPVDEPLDYVQLERWVRCRLPSESFVLLGESYSGPLAISIAADPPTQLRGVVLCCTFAQSPSRLVAALPAQALPVLAWFSTRRWASGVIALALLGSYATRPLRQLLAKALHPVKPAVLAQRLRDVACVDVTSRLKAIRLPLLALTARSDRVVPRSAARAMAQTQPLLQIQDIAGPHCLLQAEPELCAKVLLRFCGPLMPTVAA